jgi:hypothetical protein
LIRRRVDGLGSADGTAQAGDKSRALECINEGPAWCSRADGLRAGRASAGKPNLDCSHSRISKDPIA